MQNFQRTFEIRKRSFICTFSVCMTVPLNTCFRWFIRKWNKKMDCCFYQQVLRQNLCWFLSYEDLFRFILLRHFKADRKNIGSSKKGYQRFFMWQSLDAFVGTQLKLSIIWGCFFPVSILHQINKTGVVISK